MKPFSPSTASFEETFKTAYSHGLEEIYTLENVDISSIKTIQVEVKTPKKAVQEASYTQEPAFDFGEGFQESLEPFYLDEPIHVLNLPKVMERNLIDRGHYHLRDLIREGNCEREVREYLKGRLQEGTRMIHFASLIRCVIGAQERKRAKVSLDPFSLGEIVELTPIESLEIKRLSPDRLEEWRTEFRGRIAAKRKFVLSKVAEICTVLIKPWMRGRLGLAFKADLIDRLQRVSLEPELTEGALNWLSVCFFENAFPLTLIPLEEELYAVDSQTRERFMQVVERALTYFYKPHVRYTLDELSLWIKREFAAEWIGFPDGFVEKALRLSSRFIVRKGESGLMIRLF